MNRTPFVLAIAMTAASLGCGDTPDASDSGSTGADAGRSPDDAGARDAATTMEPDGGPAGDGGGPDDGRARPPEPLFRDTFETADFSSTNEAGFSWAGPNRTSIVRDDGYVVWNGEAIERGPFPERQWEAQSGMHAMRFRYPAEESWAEHRFDLGSAYPEIWFGFWLRVPINFKHEKVLETPTNNKFFALWMDGYSNHGDGPTIVWNFWQDGDTNGSRFTFSLTNEGTGVRGHHSSYSGFIRYPEDQGRWMHVVLYARMSSSADANDGEAKIWRRWEDEREHTLIGETTGRSFVPPADGPDGWAAGYVLGWANSGYAEDTEFLLDDFEVAGTDIWGAAP